MKEYRDNESWRNLKGSPEGRLSWYGHVMRREVDSLGRSAMEMEVQGKRKRGKPNERWLNRVRNDIKEKGLSEEELYDRAMKVYVVVHQAP